MFKSRKKKKTELLANHSKIKESSFYFKKIAQYFIRSDKTDALQVISDRTYCDLDLDEVFMYIDRTSSKVGQQFLYHVLRTIPESKERIDRFENLIDIFKENNKLKESVLEQLSKLDSDEAYTVCSLFMEDHIPKPKWFWMIQLISIVSVCLGLLSFFFPQLLLLLTIILVVNFFIHYWNKKNLHQYTGSIAQLLILNQVAKSFAKSEILLESKEKISKSIKVIDSIGLQTSLFKLETKLQSDLGQSVEYFFELIKALFLIEPILLFNVLKALDSKRDEIHQLYKLVGEIDVAISISSLRKELPYYTLPTFTDNRRQLIARDLYHPLLNKFVSNSIELYQKSVLLTGSNMSGKTTFIRTVGINVIASQTINTCFAREFVLPRLKIHSAIRIADDLMSDKSYYFEEVVTIKKMLKESRSGFPNLFLLDEMFKGTNTVERVAAGKSVLSYLNNEDNIVFISTHDLELADYLRETFNLYHFTEVVENESILFDYKIKAGNLKTTNAIRILELNEYPLEIITEAKRLSEQINKIKTTTSGYRD